MGCAICSNCNKLKCGCADHALATPCSYSGANCPSGEPCSEIYCAECVSYCGPTFEVDIGGDNFVIDHGDRLSGILQQIAIFMSNPACVTDMVHNLLTGPITTTTIHLNWDTYTGTGTGLMVRIKAPLDLGWTDITPALATTAISYNVTGLLPATQYMFSIEPVGTTCPSVSIYASTL